MNWKHKERMMDDNETTFNIQQSAIQRYREMVDTFASALRGEPNSATLQDCAEFVNDFNAIDAMNDVLDLLDLDNHAIAYALVEMMRWVEAAGKQMSPTLSQTTSEDERSA